MTRLVVIGGDAAGMSAASKARRVDASLEIVALEAGDWVSYSACGMPYYLAGLVPRFERLIARTPQQFQERGIEVRLRHRALALDRAARQVRVLDDGSGQEVLLPFDRLVIGTGARSRRLEVPGEHLPGVFVLRQPPDVLALDAWLKQRSPRRAVVVGAGYVGLEMVETFVSLGLDVTLLQRSPHVLSDLDEEMSRLVLEELERQGVRVLTSHTVTGVEGNELGVRAVVAEGQRVEADVVLVAIGIVPNSEIGVEAGIALGDSGALSTDDRQATSVEGIYAAGDCAEAFHRVYGGPVWLPLGTTANKQGRVAGENAAGGHARFPGIVGTAVTRMCELEVAQTGLCLRSARAAGLQAEALTITTTDIAGYYPGADRLTVRLVGERGTGRLLGGQLLGGGGVKRVDTLATALHANMTVEQVAWLDLAYAPPFSSVWDPVLVAAQELQKLL